MKKNKHGGKRKGSGAKPKPDHLKKEATKVMRIPKSLVDHVDLLIYQRRHNGKTTTIHPMP